MRQMQRISRSGPAVLVLACALAATTALAPQDAHALVTPFSQGIHGAVQAGLNYLRGQQQAAGWYAGRTDNNDSNNQRVGGTAFAVLAFSSTAQDDNAATVDSKARDILRQAADFLSGQKTFQAVGAVEYKATTPEGTDSGSIGVDVALQRPKRFAVTLEEGDFRKILISDGESLYDYMPTYAQYTVGDPPDDLARTIAII